MTSSQGGSLSDVPRSGGFILCIPLSHKCDLLLSDIFLASISRLRSPGLDLGLLQLHHGAVYPTTELLELEQDLSTQWFENHRKFQKAQAQSTATNVCEKNDLAFELSGTGIGYTIE